MVDYIKQLSDVLSENNIKQYQGKRKILNRDIESLVREVKNAFDSAQTDMENVISNNSLGISVSDFFNAVDDVVNENRITDPDKPTKLRDVQAFLNDVVDAFKESQDVANSIRNEAGLSTNEDFIETLDDLVSGLNLSDTDEKAQIRELKTAFQAVVDSFKTDTSTPGGNALETSADEILGASFGPGTLYDPSQWDSMTRYYPLDGNADDAVGSLNLTENGNPNYVSGANNDGLELDGTDDFLSGSTATFSPTSAITAVLWIDFSQFTESSNSPLLFSFLDASGGFPIFGISLNSAGSSTANEKVGTLVNTSGGFTNTSDTATNVLETETPYFFALRYDGSTIETIQDGSVVASASQSGDLASASNYAVRVGGNDGTVGNEAYTSANYIDEVALFDTALSDPDINTLYQAGA